MKKIFTFWAFLMLVAIGMQAAPQLPRFAQQNLGPAPEQAYVPVGQRINIGGPSVNQLPASNLNDDDASIYAFQVYASYGALHGWYNIQAQEPWNYELVKDFGDEAGEYGIVAATYAKDKTIAYVVTMWGSQDSGWNEIHMPIGLAVLDEKTGEFELKYNTQSFHQMEYNQTFNELTYDPTTDKIYAKEFAFDAEGNWIADRMNVYEINPNTLEPTYVGQLDDAFLTMAAHNGMVYGIVQTFNNEGYVNNTILKKADMSATVDGVFQSSVVAYMPEGGAFDYALSTMEFDHTTHRLWWLGYKNTQPILAEVDTKKAQLSHLNVLQRNAQMLGLTIPYQTAPAQAPAQVRNLVVTPAANGVGEATITWENPSWNYNRETLSDLKGVKIYRDGELITTVETTTTGASNTYKDTNVPSGMHNYKLVAYNTAGDGLAKEREEYIGEDVPGYIINLQAAPNADEVTLSWIAPAEGLHHGWYDTNAVVYDVYRGTYKVADGISETSFTDKVKSYGYYHYKVYARTSVGNGPESEVSIAFGPAMELPYENDLSEAELGAELTCIDGNGDGNTWMYSYGYKAMEYITSLEHKADDFLALPPVNLTEGKKYELQFAYYGSNYIDTYELLNVVVGQGATKEDLSTIVEEFYIEAGREGAKWYNVKAQYIAPEDGVYNFALHCLSEPYMGFLEINNIVLREMDDTEVSAAAVTGANEVIVGQSSTFTVDVVNEGLNEATNVKVELVDFDGRKLAETTVESIAVGETAQVEVAWTPAEEGEYRLFGKASVDGDYYSNDDQTPEFLAVSVLSADSDKWFTIGKDDPESYDNRMIDLSRKCSRTQIIYYTDEMQCGNNITITGLRLHYGASKSPSILTEIPLVVRMKNTDVPGIIDSWFVANEPGLEGYGFQLEDLTTVFDGTIDLSGTDPITNILEIKFDTPFEYNKDMNLIVDLEKQDDEVFEYVTWHMNYNEEHLDDYTGFDDLDGDPIYWGHMGQYNWNTPFDPTDDVNMGDNWHTDEFFFPVIKFSYKGDRTGIEALKSNSELKMAIVDGALNFTSECDFVEIYTIAGLKVAAKKNVSSISTSELPAGIYVVRALVEGNVVAKKVMIK